MASDTRARPRSRASTPSASSPPNERRRKTAISVLTAGDVEGNERLTALTGLILIILLAALGVTIIRIGQLLWLHLFLGLALLGPIALKLMSTGYRFVRYYTASPRYRDRGPPPAALRMLAPLVVLCTLAVFITGLVLLFLGPSSRQPLVLIHKVSFIVWLAVTALHVLGHLPELLGLFRAAPGARSELAALHVARPGPASGRLPGAAGRALSLAGALAVGLALAAVLIPQFASWTH